MKIKPQIIEKIILVLMLLAATAAAGSYIFYKQHNITQLIMLFVFWPLLAVRIFFLQVETRK